MKRLRAVRPSSFRRQLARKAVESLEARQFFNATFAPLATSPLSQNWTNTGLITTDNDWSGVPSIIGYNGNLLDTTTPTPLNPQTIVKDTAAGTGPNAVSVRANTTSASNNAGGVTEFEIANPTIGLVGSGNADAPNLVLNLDTTSVGNVRVQFTLRDLETSDDAVEPVALQYRIGTSGDFINVTDGFTLDATTAGAGPDTLVDTTISGIGGHSQVQLRIISVNANGNDENVGVDDIIVTGTPTAPQPGVFALNASTFQTTEGVGSYSIRVNRTNGTSGAATVDFVIANGTATSPADFDASDGNLTGTLTFANGESFKDLTVIVVQDNVIEPGGETFTVTLSNAIGATLGSPSATTVNIADDDIAGTFGFDPTTAVVNEQDGTVTLNVTRTGGSAGPVTLHYKTTAGSASDITDYIGTQNGTVSFDDGDFNPQTITIPIINDGTPESLESFTVTLTGASGSAIIGSAAVATVSIADDDVVGAPGAISFVNPTANVNEAAGTLTLTLTRSGGSTGAVTVDYATGDGSQPGGAVSPDDYTAKSGTITFADGVVTAQITINITPDTLLEDNELFSVTLSNPTGGATLGDTTLATVTILDDDLVIPRGILINEVFIDPPGANPPKQFIELKGPANASLDNVFITEVEGDFEQNPGQLDFVLDLTGKTLGSNGLLLITANVNGWVSPTDDPNSPVDPATTIVKTGLLDASTTGLEFASYSFVLLYRNSAGVAIPTIGDDYDSDNLQDANGMGTLDAMPSNLYVLDGFGTTDSTNVNDVRYLTVLPALTTGGAADAIVRITDALYDPLAFYYGILAGSSANLTLTFSSNPAQRSSNFPAGVGIVTPGAGNAGVLLSYTSSIFNPQAGQKVVVTFGEDVAASIAAGDFTLTRNGGGAPGLSLVVSSITPDGKTITLTFANTGGVSPNVLQDGTYTFTIRAGQVSGTATGAMLPTDVVTTFKFLNADFNVSGGVGFADLVLLAQSYNMSGRTFAQGDANYDGTVNFADLVVLAQRYGSFAQLAAMLVPPAPTPAVTTKGVTKKGDDVGIVPTITATPAVPATKASLGTKTAIR